MKTLWGALMVNGRGKLGGHVAQKGTYGNVLRTKVSPINRRTVPQQNRRAGIAELSRDWGTLTEVERTSWNNFAKTNPVTDVFGNAMNLSGFNMFCKVNLNFDTVGLPRSKQDRKDRREYRRVYRALASGATDGFIIDSPTPIDPGTKIALYATPSISPGLSSGGSRYSQIAILSDADTFPHDIATEYALVYGPIVAVGEKIFIKLVQISDVSGFAAPPVIASTIIIENLPI